MLDSKDKDAMQLLHKLELKMIQLADDGLEDTAEYEKVSDDWQSLAVDILCAEIMGLDDETEDI